MFILELIVSSLLTAIDPIYLLTYSSVAILFKSRNKTLIAAVLTAVALCSSIHLIVNHLYGHAFSIFFAVSMLIGTSLGTVIIFKLWKYFLKSK